jgi:pimeloyl-ACP methyl ester carboxylesterase
VIRYDHRDVGRSITSEPGRPEYTGSDLVADAAAILDGYGIPAAHVVGVSAGGAFAQLLTLEHPERVLSLTLISTSPAVPTDRALPAPTEAFNRFVERVEVDWSDPESVIEYLVAYSRVLGGGQRPFDESAARDLARREIGRAHDFAAARNHDLLREGPAGEPLSAVAVPTLVIHGTADPMFPIGHGNALADEIPNASLLRLERAGHGVEQADWETIAGAILDHTGKGGG